MKGMRVFLPGVLALLWILVTAVAQAAPPVAPGVIQVTSVTASSYFISPSVGPRYPILTAGDGGFVEPLFGLKSSLHNNDWSNMWLSDNVAPNTTWIQFDLGSSRAIDEMWVWNFNQGGSQARGMKSVNIKYGPDGVTWTTLGGAPVTLASATGALGLAATNLVGGQPIKFSGATARYVRLEAAGAKGVGNYSTTENYTGLSKVRFYEATTQPYIQPGAVTVATPVALGSEGTANLLLGAIGGSGSVVITGASFTAGQGGPAFSFQSAPTWPATFNTGELTTYSLAFRPQSLLGNYNSTLTLNMTVGATPLVARIPLSGTGMMYAPGFVPVVSATQSSGNSALLAANNSGVVPELLIGSKNSYHDNNASAMWASASQAAGPAGQWVEFDLGRSANLTEMWLWNYNATPLTALRGIKEAKILYRVNSADPWTQLGGASSTYTFNKASGEVSIPASNLTSGAPLSFGGVAARYVRIEVVSNWGDANYAGLSEVRFYESSTVTTPSIRPTAITLGKIPLNRITSRSLVMGAYGGTVSARLTSASLPAGSIASFRTPPVLPTIFNAGDVTTYVLNILPTTLGTFSIPISMEVSVGGNPVKFQVPITGEGVNADPYIITDVSATASTNYGSGVAQNTVNNTGITETVLGSKTGVHDATWTNMWLTNGKATDQWIEFDLGARYYLDEMWIWNYNQSTFSKRGIKEARIYYRPSQSDPWIQLGGTRIFTLKQATGAVGLPATNQDGTGQPVLFGCSLARYVRIEVVSNWGDTTAQPVGLAEVRFYMSPSPPSAVHSWSLFD